MQDIITPEFFYLANILSTLKIIFIFSSIISWMLFTLLYIFSIFDDKHSRNIAKDRTLLAVFILFVLSTIAFIILPDKETFYQMTIAYQINNLNIENVDDILNKIIEISNTISKIS